MMEIIEHQRFDQERALYGRSGVTVRGCAFDGPADGESANVSIVDSDIISPEFGWSSKDVELRNCTAESEYFFMRGENLVFSNVQFKGKYSFQYVKNARSGTITAPSVGEIILDDPEAQGKVLTCGQTGNACA